MFHNFFFLKRLSQKLNTQLKGQILAECFSQNKDELILGFAKSAEEECYIRANLDPRISLLYISDQFSRARKNSVDLFQELLGEQVTSVSAYAYERSFAIHFENGLSLIFKMHASRSNILLADVNQIISVFRHNLPGDTEIDPQSLAQQLDLSRAKFEQVAGNLREFLPALGKEVHAFLSQQGYDSAPLDHKWTLFSTIQHILEEAPVKVISREDDKPELTLLPLDEELQPVLETQDSLAAANKYYELFTRYFYLKQARDRSIKPLENDIRKTEIYLEKTRAKLEEITSKRKYDEIANLIMANLHQISRGSKSVELQDFYNEDQPMLTIKLNPEHSPQKNAENLYRKAKNQQQEIDQLRENIDTRYMKLLEMKEALQTLLQATSAKEIKSLTPESVSKAEDPILPYHAVVFEGFQIMVGKNARHNDELTLKIANKNDLWLHAKDVSGSHVIVRAQAGKPFPKTVIARAAELAAWSSKRKTDSLCPVIYTPKKYIRKRKGDPPGAVVVEKEQIIMIVPRGY